MNAPGNVGGGLRFGDVEEVGEGARLDGEGEAIDDFDGVADEGVVEEFGDEGLDFRDDFGAFGAFEKGIDDLAVFAVLGRVGFDGELAHRSQVFLGGDGDAEGGIGAEGLPVLGGGADLGMAEEHGDVFALEGALEDAGFLAGFAEGVFRHGLCRGVCKGYEGSSNSFGGDANWPDGYFGRTKSVNVAGRDKSVSSGSNPA